MKKPLALFEGDKLIPASEIYIVYNNKEVLMFKRAKNSKNFPGYLIGPGGHIDQNEDPLTASIREAKEETGFTLQPEHVNLKVLGFHHHIDRKEVWCEYLFRADVDQKQEIKQNTEGSAFWMNIEELLTDKKVFPPSKHYLSHILSKGSGIKFCSSIWQNLNLVKETTAIYQNPT